ncbi:MAG: DUF3592 domain-containing protein [Undibacterium sp.]|nr:DUF3592 domain-containing protein [Undibacterium sp.]
MLSLLVAFAFFAVAVHLWRWSYQQKKIADQCNLWLPISAKVIEANILKARPDFDESDTLQFRYSFIIGSYTYTGHHLNLFSQEALMDHESMRQFIEQHPLNSQLDIYYNPEAPQESAVNPSDLTGLSSYRNLAWLCCAFGACVLYFYFV